MIAPRFTVSKVCDAPEPEPAEVIGGPDLEGGPIFRGLYKVSAARDKVAASNVTLCQSAGKR